MTICMAVFIGRTWLKYLLALLSGNVDVEALRAEVRLTHS